LDLKINSVADVIEKGLETGIAVSFGGLFGSFSKAGQKRKNFIRNDGFQFSATKFLGKPVEKKLIIFERIFFSN
jgi:hypothetical protein